MSSDLDVAVPYGGAGTGALLMSHVALVNPINFPRFSTFDPTPPNIIHAPMDFALSSGFAGGLMILFIILFAFGHLVIYLCCTCRCQCWNCQCALHCPAAYWEKAKPDWVYFGVHMGFILLAIGAFVPVFIYNAHVHDRSGDLLDAVQSVFNLQGNAVSHVDTLQNAIDPTLAAVQHFVNTSLNDYPPGPTRDGLADLPSQIQQVNDQIGSFGSQLNTSLSIQSYIDRGRSYLEWQSWVAWILFGGVVFALGILLMASYIGPVPCTSCQTATEIFAVILMAVVLIAFSGLFMVLTGVSNVCTQNPVTIAETLYNTTATNYYLECDGTIASPLGPTFDDGEHKLYIQQTIIEQALAQHNNSDLLAIDHELFAVRVEVNATRDFLRCGSITPAVVNLLNVLCTSWFDSLFQWMIAVMVAIFFGIEIQLCLMPKARHEPLSTISGTFDSDAQSTVELIPFIPPKDTHSGST